MSRIVLMAVASLMLVLAWAPAAVAQDSAQGCGDFESQAAAQAALRQDPSDPDDLDQDGDGIACEDFQDFADDDRDATPVGQQQTEDDQGNGATGSANVNVAELSCEQLIRITQNADDDQYDADDDQYGNRDEIIAELVQRCRASNLGANVIPGTIPGKTLPNTGGLPLAALLGAGLVYAGVAVLRRR